MILPLFSKQKRFLIQFLGYFGHHSDLVFLVFFRNSCVFHNNKSILWNWLITSLQMHLRALMLYLFKKVEFRNICRISTMAVMFNSCQIFLLHTPEFLSWFPTSHFYSVLLSFVNSIVISFVSHTSFPQAVKNLNFSSYSTPFGFSFLLKWIELAKGNGTSTRS